MILTKDKLWQRRFIERGINMEIVQGKHFIITDLQGVISVIYKINETEREFL